MTIDVEAEVQRALAEDPVYQQLLGIQRELERMGAELGRLQHEAAQFRLRDRLRNSVTPVHHFSWRPKTPPRLAAKTWKKRQ